MAKIKEVSQIEKFREAVQEKELVARNNKAEYEKMYYHLAAVDLQEKYLTQLEKEQQERLAQNEEILAQTKAQVEAQNEAATQLPDETTKVINM